MRSRWAGLAAVILAVGATLAFWTIQCDRAFEGALAEARESIRGGRHATARRQLADLVDRRPEHGEVLYLLGLAEQLLGHPDRAEAAWKRIGIDDPHRGMALLHWADIDQARGRLADAEDRLRDALELEGPHRPMARWSLVTLLRHEGRFDEARRLFRDGLAEHPEPVMALKVLYKLDVDAYPIDVARRDFDEAHRRAPDDDRVWLGLAHLAARTGHLDEARRWLDRCVARRPDDPAVWRARLDLGREAGEPVEVAEAAAHLPAGPDSDREALELRAWLAGRAGARAVERAVLETWNRADPGNTEVIDRLAAIAAEQGRTDAVAALRTERAAIERARSTYVALLKTDEPLEHADELAAQAVRLGRRFDGRAWAALEAGGDALATVVERSTTDAESLDDLIPEGELVAARNGSTALGISEGPVVPRFRDIAAAVGLDFRHDRGNVPGRLILPETGAGGVALLDFDGDGWLDVYAVQGGAFPHQGGPSADRLFRNQGDGTFEDASMSSGLDAMPGGFGHGAAVGDIDNDGDPDLFITRWRSYALYLNRGDGTFEDATDAVGLGGDRDWPTSAAFADLDNDGDLDLYVCHYLAWDEHDDRTCFDPDDPAVYACNPLDFPSLPDHVFRNDNGRFVDVSTEAGINDRDGRGLGVVAADVDGDRLVDLFVANDMTADDLFMNRGAFRFEEVGALAGVSANAQGSYQAGMGTACGDLDGDARLDLLVTNYYGESTTFFRNLGGGFFADQTAAVGLSAPTRHLLGFGLTLPDVNNDGRLDLLSANGHVHDGRPLYPWTMPAQLLLGGPDGRLHDPGDRDGGALATPHLGRGLAVGDLDNDGRLDAVLLAQDEPLVYLHNATPDAGQWLTLRLEGSESNRDGVGSLVTVEAVGRRRIATRNGGGSFQSAGDPRLHFGLGDAVMADAVEVRWPSGRTDRFDHLPAGVGYLIREGEGEARPLVGFADGDAIGPHTASAWE